MNHFIFFLVSGMLLLASGASAEELYLNCKFENGTSMVGKRARPIYKGDAGTTDINIILDTRKKKIIEAPFVDPERTNFSQNKFGKEEHFSSSWSDNEVKWSYSSSVKTTRAQLSDYYILNRRSGVLKSDFMMSDNDNAPTSILTNYQCSKQDKKF
jgi:hypothetical protein